MCHLLNVIYDPIKCYVFNVSKCLKSKRIAAARSNVVDIILMTVISPLSKQRNDYLRFDIWYIWILTEYKWLFRNQKSSFS